ncbi:MAG: hypothetical protein ACP5US_09900 [Candidatus Kryptoniota bacterium]
MSCSITRYSRLLVVILSMTGQGVCQLNASEPAASQNLTTLGFNRNINTLTWNALAGANWSSNGFSASLNDLFRSVLIKGEQNLIRDEQNLAVYISRQITPAFNGFAAFNSGLVSDNRQIGLSSVGGTTILGGLEFLTGSDTIRGGIGNRWDRQAGISDEGLTYDLTGSSTFKLFSSGQVSPGILMHDEQIFPRRNSDRVATITYNQIFPYGSSVNFFGSYAFHRRDFYFPADSATAFTFNVKNNIQQRDETTTSFAANIATPISIFNLTMGANYSQRLIAFDYTYKLINDPLNNLFDTRIRVNTFNFNTQLSTGGLTDSMLVSFVHNERYETHSVLLSGNRINAYVQRSNSESQLDNIGARNTLSIYARVRLGMYLLSLNGLASLLRYNTPSQLNYDDRDELTNTLSLRIERPFTSYLTVGLGAEADLIHIVYIMSQRSANNNRNFVYRLYPMIYYNSPSVSSYNKFEVLANYTVYDFEAFSQVHSYSYRQVSYFDSTRVQFTNRVSAFFLGSLKIYTRGELYWQTFSEYPLNYFVDQNYWFALSYKRGIMQYSVGYRILSLSQYDYITSKTKEFVTNQKSEGPTAYMAISMNRLQIRISGWYQVSVQTAQQAILYPNFELKATYIL